MDDISALIHARLAGPREDRMIAYRGSWISRGWMHDFVEELDRALDALGLDKDAPVGFAPQTQPEFIAALLGLLARGRSIVMIYAYQSGEALARKVTELRLPVAIAAESQWPGAMLDAARAAGTAAIAISRGDEPIRTLAPYLPDRDHRQPSPEPGIDMLTSGTTGAPKHFPISYRKLFSRMVLNNASASTERVPGLLFFPLGNISGIYILLPLIAADSPIIVLDKFEVAAWLDYVQNARPTVANVPTAAFRMILDANVDPAALEPVRYIVTGASTLDPTLRRQFEARYDIPILQSYGATEFGGVVASVTPAHIEEFGRAKSDSVGRPFGGATWRVVDVDSGGTLPAGQEGRLEVLQPAMADDWITTTDLCMIDDDGFLYHRGRLDGAIMRGGFKIIPEQVAEALSAHPAVAAAAVVGLPDERLGQVPAAAVQLAVGSAAPSPAELEAFLRESLPATMLPKRYKVMPALPRTPSFKVDMAAVRALFDDAGGV
jgi:acyl-CoA synthetase (AMP-forming)/AMP-acid ligase II